MAAAAVHGDGGVKAKDIVRREASRLGYKQPPANVVESLAIDWFRDLLDQADQMDADADEVVTFLRRKLQEGSRPL
jgi:hypothetical protein